MNDLSQKVALTSFQVVTVGASVAASAFHAVNNPIYYYASASTVFKLRSQVLQNHAVLRECMNNILPLSSLKII